MAKGYKYKQISKGARAKRTMALRDGLLPFVDVETRSDGTTESKIRETLDYTPAVYLDGRQTRALYIALRKHYVGY